jgi:hypothetical protein
VDEFFFSVQIPTFWGPKKCETPGNFLVKFGQVRFNAKIQATSLPLLHEKNIYISKMVRDSDLQSLPVLGMVFGDTLVMYPTLLLRPPPLMCHVLPKQSKFSKSSMSSKNFKILFGWGGQGRLDFLSLDRGDLDG